LIARLDQHSCFSSEQTDSQMFYDSTNDRLELNTFKQDKSKFEKDIKTLKKDFAALMAIKNKNKKPLLTNISNEHFPDAELSPIAMKI